MVYLAVAYYVHPCQQSGNPTPFIFTGLGSVLLFHISEDKSSTVVEIWYNRRFKPVWRWCYRVWQRKIFQECFQALWGCQDQCLVTRVVQHIQTIMLVHKHLDCTFDELCVFVMGIRAQCILFGRLAFLCYYIHIRIFRHTGGLQVLCLLCSRDTAWDSWIAKVKACLSLFCCKWA